MVIVEGLDAQAVSPQHDAPALGVHDREAEHARDAFDDPRTPLLISVQHHLGVAVRAEDVPSVDQFLAQFQVVVYLAVDHDAHVAVLVDHGLAAPLGQVDDGQASVPQAGPAAHVIAVSVRPPVHQALVHGLDQAFVFPAESVDAAHTRPRCPPGARPRRKIWLSVMKPGGLCNRHDGARRRGRVAAQAAAARSKAQAADLGSGSGG